MSKKHLQKMTKDDKTQNVIVMTDPVVVEWKVRLIEQYFEKSKSYENEIPKPKMTKNDMISSILEDLLEKVDSSTYQSPKESGEMNGNTIHQTISLSENDENGVNYVKTEIRKIMENVEVAKYNEFNYWKIEVDCSDCSLEIEDEINSKEKDLAQKSKEAGRDIEIIGEMPEYNDNNWWKPNDYILNIKVEIENYEQEVVSEQCDENAHITENDISSEVSKFNEFNFWKLDIHPINLKTENNMTFHASPNTPNFNSQDWRLKPAAEKYLKKDDQMAKLTPIHKSHSSGQIQDKSKSNKRSQSNDQLHKSQGSGRINQISKLKPNQSSQRSDQRSESPAVMSPMSSVVMIYNLNPSIMDCDRLFNIVSPYAKVRSIKFLKQIDFRTAMVELYSIEGARRVLSLLNGITIFGKFIKIEPSPKNRVTEFNPRSSPYMPNGSDSFKDFSKEKFGLYYHSSTIKQAPTRTLYFYQTPKMTNQEFFGIFEKLKAPIPYKVMWFQNHDGMGCLQFKSQREALEAICMTNLAIINAPGQRVHLAFTHERKDYQFYSGKI